MTPTDPSGRAIVKGCTCYLPRQSSTKWSVRQVKPDDGDHWIGLARVYAIGRGVVWVRPDELVITGKERNI